LADLTKIPAITTQATRPEAVITFDDGLKNNLSEALPLLEKHGVPATIYVSTGAVETGMHFWWDQLILSIQVSGICRLDLRPHGLSDFDLSPDSKGSRLGHWEKIQKLLEALKRISPLERERTVAHILSTINSVYTQAVSPFQPLSAGDIAELSKHPLIRIGSHTHCHSILSQIPTSQAELSIERSLHLLRDWTNQPIRHFSFPNGVHVSEVEPILREKGLATAVTCNPGRFRRGNSLFKIPRIPVGGYDTLIFFIANLIGGSELLNLKAKFDGNYIPF
jgi:peptidoglycan/xylan/chitin deacetylase (PgdA/CDA1 family)